MCTGKCAKFIGVSLYPLAVAAIICNILLFFPAWDTKYVQEDTEGSNRTITEEVKYMGGLVGGGIMVLIPAIHIHATGKRGCCANRCGMFLSIAFAAVGVVGSLYCLVVSSLGLVNGPTCEYENSDKKLIWGTPFKTNQKFGNESYLFDKNLWSECIKPKDVVEFNVILFSILLVLGVLETLLCAFQMINGLFGCLCGTCGKKGQA
ncbi:transmembrane 4 L6 family member 5-like isoform X2 [Erpetoichthys calabaricus]|uniref:transmembrane 4 L6 family member 5-like isoform X2 n=1 Tax=Erpetoichthys calabaricus TaxID=27687 RepID=UPI0010A0BC64|nr:transmembrane 4 L6 family member 5-like isoform X2 [Erpetoichthys calabaricus]